jgi:hypothetical protein
MEPVKEATTEVKEATSEVAASVGPKMQLSSWGRVCCTLKT